VSGELTREMLDQAFEHMQKMPPLLVCQHIVSPRALTVDGVYVCGSCGQPLPIKNGVVDYSEWLAELQL
jgi:hypothetical protein